MSKHTRKDFETLGEAASRLLEELAKRADKASGGFERPEQIGAATISDHALPAVAAGSTTGTDAEENAAEGSAEGNARHLRQQRSVASLGGACGDGLEFDAANDNLAHAALRSKTGASTLDKNSSRRLIDLRRGTDRCFAALRWWGRVAGM